MKNSELRIIFKFGFFQNSKMCMPVNCKKFFQFVQKLDTPLKFQKILLIFWVRLNFFGKLNKSMLYIESAKC